MKKKNFKIISDFHVKQIKLLTDLISPDENRDEHDCHLSAEDGCDYCNQKREEREQEEYSEDYPLGGLLEPHDIERDRRMELEERYAYEDYCANEQDKKRREYA